MTHDEYVDLLMKIRGEIVSGLKLHAIDSEDIGDKYTTCNWGVCGHRNDLKQDDWQLCPFDRQDNQMCIWHPGTPLGCFYRCEIFSPHGNEISRYEALKAYDKQIARGKQ